MANRQIFQLTHAASATDAARLPVAEALNVPAAGLTRLEYCRISAESGTSTKMYNEVSGKCLEASSTFTGLYLAGVPGVSVLPTGARMNAPDLTTTLALVNGACVLSYLTADRVVVTDGSKVFQSSTVTTTVLNYITNVTSDVQTQINNLTININTRVTNSISTNRVWGRTTAGTGVVEELAPTLGIVLSALTIGTGGAYTANGFTISTARLLGRTTAATGAAEEISIGYGLTMAATVLSADLAITDLGTASGAQVVNFLFAASTLTANGNVTLTSSNRVAGRATQIKIVASGADRTITPSASWKWVGSDLTSFVIPSGKAAIISIFAYGTAETDIWGSGAIQP